MPYLGTTEVMPVRGVMSGELHPVAATQTLVVGDPVYLVGGKVTKSAAASASITSAQPPWGIMLQKSTLQAVDTMVSVHVFEEGDLLVLPSYGAAPTVAICGNGANTAGYTIYNDAGVYKIDLGTTANPIVRARNLDMTDARNSFGTGFKATLAVGDRVICKLLARQF